MIQTRRFQRCFADGLIAEEIDDLREPWMSYSDAVLGDDRLLEIVQQATGAALQEEQDTWTAGYHRRGRCADVAAQAYFQLQL